VWFTYCWAMYVFYMDPSRDYIGGTEQNQTSRRTRMRMGPVLGGKGRRVRLKTDYKLLQLIVNTRNCTKKMLIIPTIRSRTRYY
jgi:hypothetical protein